MLLSYFIIYSYNNTFNFILQYIKQLTKAAITSALGYTPPTSDTNTWRGIQNNLTSTSTSDSLSAYQGKILNDKVNLVGSSSTSSSNVTAQHAVIYTIASLKPAAGTYLFWGSISFSGNASGRRLMQISTSTAYGRPTASIDSSGSNDIYLTGTQLITVNGNQTVYMIASQHSGGTISMGGILTAIRLK